MNDTDRTHIPLSYINTLLFCNRRFYYEYVMGEMVINEHVLEGALKHARPDRPMQNRSERGKLVTRRQYLASDRLRVAGYTDVIEEHNGACYPVEYKKGKGGNWLNDKVQLCLQGMLLEEAIGRPVPFGYLYYIGSNRRRKILFDANLRQTSLDAVEQAFQVAAAARIPEPVHDNRCNGCSLRSICLPDEVAYLHGLDSPPTRIQTSPGIDDVVYVDEQGAMLKKQGERILVVKGEANLAEFPLIHVGQVVVCGGVAITTPLLQLLFQRSIPVVFLSQYGRYHGRIVPEVSGNSLLRMAQYRVATDPDRCLALAQCFVRGKLYNMRKLLLRYKDQDGTEAIQKATVQLHALINRIERATTLDELLGVEGSGSAEYFRVFGRLLKSGMGFDFDKRTRRPPADPVNSLLSFAYTLLTSDMGSAVQTVGLDPYIGFYHQIKYGKPCLALDLMEEFRPIVADSVVLTLINNRIIGPEDFTQAYGGWFLSDSARKRFYAVYERRKNETITHPTFGYRLAYRRAFELQARILAKYLVGEIDTYDPLTVR